MGVALSESTEARLRLAFSDADRESARLLLVSQCADNLPGFESASPKSLERVRFAAIRIARGDLRALIQAVDLAKTDWRDLLVHADFANDVTAHEAWWP